MDANTTSQIVRALEHRRIGAEIMTSITIVPEGAFSLAAAANFGFGPNSGRPTASGASMRLAFVADDMASHAFVSLNQKDDGTVVGEVESDAPVAVVEAQVRRILSLDGSGTEWAKVGDRDPVLGGMQRAHPGLRPVLFHSPYEAAAWSVISARRQRNQGIVARNRIAGALGRTYGDGTEQLTAFPTPDRLLELGDIQGLEAVKVERLHAVARAALDGQLEPRALLQLAPDAALEHLQRLPGIGPTYSMLILLRSTGARDILVGGEPRLSGYLAHFYGLDAPATPAEIEEIAEGWRPFRTWSAVLTRVAGDSLGLPLPALARPGSRPRR
jgi:DNA-3-methyladenine glycosylase II